MHYFLICGKIQEHHYKGDIYYMENRDESINQNQTNQNKDDATIEYKNDDVVVSIKDNASYPQQNSEDIEVQPTENDIFVDDTEEQIEIKGDYYISIVKTNENTMDESQK